MDFWTPALIALFAWWFSTGAILWVVKSADRLGARARQRAVIAGLPVLGLGIAGFFLTLDMPTVRGAYGAFFAALAIWGWIELSFLVGVVTGPNRHVLPEGTPEWERFVRAWGTIAYHEMLLAGTAIVLFLVGWDAANPIAVWTFGVLFFARVSAKLNLFFGVPRIHVDFLPTVLSHLPSHFRFRALNWLFPVSVTVLTFAVACWLERFAVTTDPAQIAGFALLTAITALALLEHWMMVLPIPDEKLWRWMMPAAAPVNDPIPTTKIKGGHNGL